eukprot:CAMPEP_0196587124 /NCGR_PEP_ID=MMETSP1081-20130531/56519_1 /TAXON_ID=36882 /ORGANISM="Pyramimonas amylifera, Strain CCMP720" /LENGTH=354 /DNA_ID=CAMNT_0041909223 /DNA_START=144 /DNA_END=1208 /DNA_ORIENTATION=-
MTLWEWVKLVLLMPLALFRVLVVLLILAMGALVGHIVCRGMPDDQPLTSWRRVLIQYSYRFFSRFGLFCMGFIYINVRGYENLIQAQQSRAVVIINHVSYLDGLVLQSFFLCTAVAKGGLAHVPLMGTIGRALRVVFVERQCAVGVLESPSAQSNRKELKRRRVEKVDTLSTDPESKPARGNSARIAERAKDPAFPLVFMAPEATCSTGRQLLKFKTGAFVTGQPILPIVLRYPHRNLCASYNMCYFPFRLLRLLTQVINHADLTIMEMHNPTDEEVKDPVLYAKTVRSKMAAVLGVPVSDQGLEEMASLCKADISVAHDGKTVTGDLKLLSEYMAEAKSKQINFVENKVTVKL